MIELQIGSCCVRIWKGGEPPTLVTYFPDGSELAACPHDTDEYRECAAEMGYRDDTWAMCREHELLHSAMAVMEGREYSWTLYQAANGREGDTCEEARVLAMQKHLNEVRWLSGESAPPLIIEEWCATHDLSVWASVRHLKKILSEAAS